MISSSVTGSVVAFPCTTIPRLSPTRMASTPAASNSPAHRKSYAVSTDSLAPRFFASTNRGTVTGRCSVDCGSPTGLADMNRLSSIEIAERHHSNRHCVSPASPASIVGDGAEGEPVGEFGEQFRDEQLDAIAPRVLGAIERQIAALQQRIDIGRDSRFFDGDSRGDRHGQPRAGDGEGRALYGCTKAFGLPERVLSRASRERHEELLPPITADTVVIAKLRPQASGDLPEHNVPHKMPVGVVDELEVVNVGQDHPDRRVLAVGARRFLHQELVNRPPVPEVGELVVRGLLLQGSTGVEKVLLKVDDTASGAQAKLEFRVIDRLAEVVIGPGF